MVIPVLHDCKWENPVGPDQSYENHWSLYTIIIYHYDIPLLYTIMIYHCDIPLLYTIIKYHYDIPLLDDYNYLVGGFNPSEKYESQLG